MLRRNAGTLRTGHVGLNVTDVDRSIDFYGTILGLECVLQSKTQGEEWAFLAQDGDIVLTLWKQSDGVFPVDRPGLHHLSFQVGSIEEVREFHARACEAGAEVFHGGVVPHGEGLDSGGVFFTDPDGIRLEIFTMRGACRTPAPTQSSPTCGFFSGHP